MKRLGEVALLLAASCIEFFGQDISGAIGGIVMDPSGAPVANAAVRIINTDRNQTVRTIKTDSSGLYTAPFIPIGNYTIAVSAPGFKVNTRTGIVLNVSDDLKFNITMEVGAVTE